MILALLCTLIIYEVDKICDATTNELNLASLIN